jgi:hypothetical protein
MEQALFDFCDVGTSNSRLARLTFESNELVGPSYS